MKRKYFIPRHATRKRSCPDPKWRDFYKTTRYLSYKAVFFLEMGEKTNVQKELIMTSYFLMTSVAGCPVNVGSSYLFVGSIGGGFRISG
jgi:hypothetical protein